MGCELGVEVIGSELMVRLSLPVSFELDSEVAAPTPEFLDRSLRHEVKYDLLAPFEILGGKSPTTGVSSETEEGLNSGIDPCTPTSLPSFFDRDACT